MATAMPDVPYLLGESLFRDLNGQSRHIGVSVVMPCLNEEDSVAVTVTEAFEGIRRAGLTGEVIVVDNGSTDESMAEAVRAGATVVQETHRGYGNACRRGLAEACGDIVILGDSDGTYDFRDIPRFVAAMTPDVDVVMGNRLHRGMEGGAMPWLHRHFGNPGLTGMLNLLHGARVSDAHCGLRAVRRNALAGLELRASGMEFASEFVIASMSHRLGLAELPITYRRRLGGVPKLRTWSDGWRHVRLVFGAWLEHFVAKLSTGRAVGLKLAPATEPRLRGPGEFDADRPRL